MDLSLEAASYFKQTTNSWVPQKCGNRKQVPQVPQCGIKCGTMCGNMLLSFLLSAQIVGRSERSAHIGR